MRFLCVLAMALSACTAMPDGIKAQPSVVLTVAQSQVFIIYFDMDKKDKLLSVIHQHGDGIIYDYQNFNAMAVKITAGNLNEKLKIYHHTDGVLQILTDQTIQLH